MNQGGVGAQVVGGILVGFTGILVIAAIYQLNKQNTPLVPAASSAYNNTLSNIFK